MLLRLVAVARFRVCAVLIDRDGEHRCAVLEELATLALSRQADVRGIRQRLHQYAVGGRKALTAEMLHEADKSRGIWQFKKGDVRVFCFFGDEGLVVLSSAGLKKGQKADPAAIDRAARLLDAYLQARVEGRITWEP